MVPIVVGALGTVPKDMEKKNGEIGNQRKNRHNLDDGIIMIGYNTEKSPGDLTRLPVIQSPVKDHKLTLVWKTLKE